MATNKSTIVALEKMTKRFDEFSKMFDEMKAMNKLLKFHLRAQKKQKGLYHQDTYKFGTYSDKTPKVTRLSKGKELYSY